jgi:2-methylcitrate dehydratase
MVAVPLIFGQLTADDYEDGVAADPRIDALRAKMQVKENPTFTQEYYDADKRYIGNAVQVFSR